MSTSAQVISPRERSLIIGAALVALFLGALDSLIMSAAMPTIVADLGGLSLYAWVYSAYFLARAIALPVFGKLADIYGSKKLFLASICLFLAASVAAGSAQSMAFLIFCRIFQGIGAGGNFAFVYIILSQVAPPGKRAQTLSLGSFIWGISSMIGPTLGGFIVSYASWRWIFYINIPLGVLSLIGIGLFLKESEKKHDGSASLDVIGLLLFSGFVLGLLTVFTTGGREFAWRSGGMLALVMTTVVLGCCFVLVEKKAKNPMIDLRFFRLRNFALGNGATFLASFTIFAFFAYVPLYIQGSLALSPMQVGLAMVSLSLGWSAGAMFFGRMSRNGKEKNWSVVGGGILLIGSLFTLRFNLDTSMAECFSVFLVVGTGMGFVSLSTVILVQNSVGAEDLGIVTSFHQFSRSLGGTIGVGFCGGLVTTGMLSRLAESAILLPQYLMVQLMDSTENLLRPEFMNLVPQEAIEALRNAVLSGVFSVFWIASCSSFLCLLCCLGLVEGRSEPE